MIHNVIKKLLVDIKDPVIFEVGCRQGEDTIHFANNFPDGKIFAFEPLPSNFEIAKKNLFGINNIWLMPYALSDREGEFDFWISSDPEDFNGSSSLKEPKEHLIHFNHVKFNKIIKVPTTTLDNFVKSSKIGHIDFLFLDTQGAEADIIKGGSETLKKTKYLYTETYEVEMYQGQTNLRGLQDLLGSNWRLVHKFPNDVLFENINYNANIFPISRR